MDPRPLRLLSTVCRSTIEAQCQRLSNFHRKKVNETRTLIFLILHGQMRLHCLRLSSIRQLSLTWH